MPLPFSIFSIQFIRNTIIASTGAFLLSACGGTGEDLIGSQYDINVALASSGATTSASYDPDSADFTIDGITNTSEAWAGNVSGNYVKIDFGQLRQVREIKLFTSDNGNQTNRRVEISSNNSTWFDTLQSSSVAIPCTTVTSNSTSITCAFAERKTIRYLRFTTLTSSPLNVYEIEVTGY